MRKRFDRIAWYMSLAMILAGLWMMNIPVFTDSFFHAIVLYVMGFFFAVPFSWILRKVKGYPMTTFGIETERFGGYLTIVGVIATIAAGVWGRDDPEVIVVAIVVVLYGIDGVIWARECKYDIEQGNRHVVPQSPKQQS